MNKCLSSLTTKWITKKIDALYGDKLYEAKWFCWLIVDFLIAECVVHYVTFTPNVFSSYMLTTSIVTLLSSYINVTYVASPPIVVVV